MIDELLHNKDFNLLMKEHAKDIVEWMLDEEFAFSVVVETARVTFEPPLPSNIKTSFSAVSLFTLAGYTLQSADTDEEYLFFEAGFGKDNFGSLVTLPFSSIIQIIIDETPIFVNMSYSSSAEMQDKNQNKRNGVEKSMDIFLSNPENKKLLTETPH